MLIDAHNHPNWRGHNARKALQNMDDMGIDQMWVMSWEALPDELPPSSYPRFSPTTFGASLEDVLSFTSLAPDRFIAGYAPHPKRPDAIQRLRAAVDIHDVRVASEYKSRVVFDDPDALRFYEACAELELPITIHLDYSTARDDEDSHPWPNWWYGGTIEALERAVVACPKTAFIGHGGGFWAHISGDDKFKSERYPQSSPEPGGKVPEMLATYPNLYGDLSARSGFFAITRDEVFGRQFLLDNQDKILFGRDAWDSKLMDTLLKMELPREVFDKITYQTAQRLVRPA